MSANIAYGIGEVSDIVGVSTRTLRYYEEEGLLVPARTANGYRRYTPADLDRLQEILLLRHMGMSVAEIPSALSATGDERRRTLARHLGTLRVERERLDTLIRADERSRAILERSGSNESDSIPSSAPSNAQSSTSRRESPWTIRRSSRT